MIVINSKKITSFDDLYALSGAYKKGMIKINISRLAKELKCDRKTVRKALNGQKRKNKRERKSYLDDYKDIMIELLEDKYREFEYINHFYKFMVREYGIRCVYSTFRRYIVNDEMLSNKFKQKKNHLLYKGLKQNQEFKFSLI